MKDRINSVRFRRFQLVSYGIVFALLGYIAINFALAGPKNIVAKPSAVVALTNANGQSRNISLSWSVPQESSAIDGYYVIRSGVTIGQTASTTYIDTSAKAGANYSYEVMAFNAGGVSPKSRPLTVKVPQLAAAQNDTTPPSAPTNLNLISDGSKQVNLRWDRSNDDIAISHYEIYRNNQKFADVESTNFGDTTISPNSTYTYWVVAVDQAGNRSSNSNKATITASGGG